MDITFTGTNSYFFSNMVFSDFLDVAANVTQSSTQVVFDDPGYGYTLTFNGTGLGLGPNGPTGGTVTSIIFTQNGVQQASFTDIAWSFIALSNARDAVIDQGNI